MGVQNGATGTSKLQNMSGKRWTFWGESILIGVWLMIMENQVRCHQRSAASVDSFLCLTFWYKACQTVQHLSFWMLAWLSDTKACQTVKHLSLQCHVVCVNVGASLRLMPVWQKKVPALSDECNKPVHWLHLLIASFVLHFDFEMFTSHCILKLIDHDLEDLVCADSFLAVLLSVPANSCLVRLVQSSECPELSQTKYNPCQLLDPERGLVKMFCY